MDYTMAGVEDILGPMGKAGHLKIRDKYFKQLCCFFKKNNLFTYYFFFFFFYRFKQIDNKYIRPFLIREHAAHEPKILETYSRLAMKDAMEQMKRTGSNLTGGANSESMAVLFRNYTSNNLSTRFGSVCA